MMNGFFFTKSECFLADDPLKIVNYMHVSLIREHIKKFWKPLMTI